MRGDAALRMLRDHTECGNFAAQMARLSDLPVRYVSAAPSWSSWRFHPAWTSLDIQVHRCGNATDEFKEWLRTVSGPLSGRVVRIAENRFLPRLLGALFEEMAILERQRSGFTVPAIAARSSCKTNFAGEPQ